MSKYYVSGFTPPDDVLGSDDVKKYQRLLGVSVDGIWGKQTQAAYERYQNEGGELGKNNGMGNGDIDWDTVTKQISTYIQSALRPSVDNAIEQRKEAASEQNAELDADAAARGMQSSTYVSSMKAREQDDVSQDITALESSYQSALARELYDAILTVTQMRSEKEQRDREYALDRERLEQESEQFYAQLAAQNNSGGSDSDDEQEGSIIDAVVRGTYTYKDYVEYIEMLPAVDRNNIFYSKEVYWCVLRDNIRRDIGDAGYAVLEDRFTETYGDSGRGGFGASRYMETQ